MSAREDNLQHYEAIADHFDTTYNRENSNQLYKIEQISKVMFEILPSLGRYDRSPPSRFGRSAMSPPSGSPATEPRLPSSRDYPVLSDNRACIEGERLGAGPGVLTHRRGHSIRCS